MMIVGAGTIASHRPAAVFWRAPFGDAPATGHYLQQRAACGGFESQGKLQAPCSQRRSRTSVLATALTEGGGSWPLFACQAAQVRGALVLFHLDFLDVIAIRQASRSQQAP